MRVCFVLVFALAMSLRCESATAQNRIPVDEQFRIKFGFADQPRKDAHIYLPMLKRSLTTELHFAKRICRPSDTQFDAIHTAGAKAVTSIANTYADNARRRTAAQRWPDPNESIAISLAESIHQLMPPDIAENYEAVTKARFAANRAANAALLTNIIDRQVLLDLDQQEKIYQTLRDEWQPHWSPRNILLTYAQYAVLPDALIVHPHLTDLQKSLWSSGMGRRRVTLSWQVHFRTDQFFGGIALPEFDPPDNPGGNDGEPDEQRDCQSRGQLDASHWLLPP